MITEREFIQTRVKRRYASAAICGAFLTLFAVSGSPSVADTAVPIALWVGGADDARFNARFDNFVKVMGRTPQFNVTYVDVRQPARTWASYAAYEAGVMANNSRTMKAIPFIGWGFGTTPDGNLSSQIATGKYDMQITGALGNWKQKGYRTLYLRPGWEMNQAFPWKLSKANAGTFVAAFKHFVTVVRKYASDNKMQIRIVWNPGVDRNQSDHSVNVSDMYPGADYVDILAIDFYSEPVDPGWRGHAPTGKTSDPGQYLVSTMIDMAARDKKPIAFGEIGGTNPAFVQDVINALNSRPQGVQIALMGLWDINDGNGIMSFTDSKDKRDDLLDAWKAGFGPNGSVRNQ